VNMKTLGLHRARANVLAASTLFGLVGSNASMALENV